MAAKRALLKELKAGDFNRELEERNVNLRERKVELQQKFRQALIEEVDDPNVCLMRRIFESLKHQMILKV